MLVLSRKLFETIRIGDNIEVTICDIRGDKIRLGVTAPSEVVIDRGEVHGRKQRQAEPGTGAVGEAATVPRS